MPVAVARTTPPPADPSIDGRFELALDPQHLLLHLLRHPLQVGHAHAGVSFVDSARRSVCGNGPSAAARAAGRSADLADVDEVVGEDPARLGEHEGGVRGLGRDRRQLDVRDDAADVDRIDR